LYRGEVEDFLGFVRIPAGSFVMGEGKEEQTLEIAYDYWLARYPVTVAQFRDFVKDRGQDLIN
jgi:formylglycine-generating enzyme required for sulfatase activity